MAHLDCLWPLWDQSYFWALCRDGQRGCAPAADVLTSSKRLAGACLHYSRVPRKQKWKLSCFQKVRHRTLTVSLGCFLSGKEIPTACPSGRGEEKRPHVLKYKYYNHLQSTTAMERVKPKWFGPVGNLWYKPKYVCHNGMNIFHSRKWKSRLLRWQFKYKNNSCVFQMDTRFIS